MLTFDFFSVEVSVAVAGGAVEGFDGAFFSTGHELSAAIGGSASHGGCMVFEAFSVPDHLLEGGWEMGVLHG